MANPAFVLCMVIQLAFPHGRVIDSVRSPSDSGERYAIYLPTRYDSTHRWPLLFVMDPRGRAVRALERFREGAERDGYVVVSSYNTASDSTEEPNLRALNAVLRDAPQWFQIDTRRLYLAGFSGTARLAWHYGVQLRGHVAGVIGVCAGLPWLGIGAYVRLHDSASFAFFGGSGNLDFNYDEVHDLQGLLDTLGTVPHQFAYYRSPHAWPPPNVGAMAIDWMSLEAMKTGLAPRNDSLIATWFDIRLASANAARDSGQLFEASRRYRAMGDDFRGVHDVAAVAAAADSLSRLKAVRDEASHRRSLTESSEHYMSDVFPRFQTAVDSSRRPPTLDRSLSMLDLRDLQRRARDSTDRLDSDAARRLLTSVFVSVGFYMPRVYLARGDGARALAVLNVANAIDSTDSDVREGLVRAHALLEQH